MTRFDLSKLFDSTDAFCESKILGACPEWFNVLSSFSFCLISFISYKKNNLKNFPFFFFHIYFFSIGLGSSIYHGLCMTLGKALDEGIMILTTMMLISYHVYVLKCTDQIKFVIGFIVSSYYILLLIVNTIILKIEIFVVLFMIPIVAGVLFLKIKKPYIVNQNSKNGIFANRIIKIALWCLIISCIVWVTTELMCIYYDNIIFLIGHPIWHIGMSISTHYFFQYIYFIDLANNNRVNIEWYYTFPIYYIREKEAII